MRCLYRMACMLALLSTLVLTACSSGDEGPSNLAAQYKYGGLSTLHVAFGQEETAKAFQNELNQVLADFNGAEYVPGIDQQIINGVQQVVDRYSPGCMEGMFSLMKAEGTSGQFESIRTFMMTMRSGY